MRNNSRKLAALSLVAAFTLLAGTLTTQFLLAATTRTVQTNAVDYPVGAQVTVSGSGWASGTVTVTIKNSQGTQVSATGTPSTTNGSFTLTNFYQTTDVGTFTVTATQGSNKATATFSVTALGLFEITDGDSKWDGTALHDWDQVFNDLKYHTSTAGTNALQFTHDPVGSASDDEFSNSPKDTQDISQWLWSRHVASSAKVDLADALAAAYEGPETGGHKLLYVAADRFGGSGSTAAMSIWVLQNPIATKADGTFVNKNTGLPEQHVNGDLLIVASLGNPPSVDAYRWQNGSLQSFTLSAAQARYAINLAAIDVPWNFKDSTGLTKPQAQEFFEVGIDLTNVFGATTPDFSSFIITSRTSNSLTSSLSDFILGGISTFHGDIAVTKTDGQGLHVSQVSVGDPVQFSIDVHNGGLGVSDADLLGVTLNDPLPAGLSWTFAPNGNPNNIFTITGTQGSQVLTFASSNQELHGTDRLVAVVQATTSASSIGVITNTATVSAFGDPNASNNTDSASIVVMPVAQNDLALMPSGGNVSVAAPGVLSNDGANGSVLSGYTVESVAGSNINGTVTLNPNGSFTFTPVNYGLNGSFKYHILYTYGGNTYYSNDATVTIATGAGTLTVNKTVVNDNGGSKTAAQFSFSVGGSSYSFQTVDALHGTKTVTLPAGPGYSVTEPSDPAYAATSNTCTNLTVTKGQTISCDITNDDQQGTLIVKKIVVNDNGGTKKATDFSFQVGTDAAIAFLQDGANQLAGKNTLALNAGTYTITEPHVDGYATTYSNCSNVSLSNGGTQTCIITNNDVQPTLKVVKTVTNDNGGQKQISDFVLKIDATQVASGTATAVNAGPHTVSEVNPPAWGYQASAWGGDCAADGSITLQPGDNKVCTITNDDIQPTLKVVKTVTNDNGGQKQVSDFVLKIDATEVTSGVANPISAGTHTVSEVNPPAWGYQASAWGGDCAANGSITLLPGDNKTCTITNDDQAATLIVKKHVVNDNGGSKTAADFTLAVTGGSASPATFAGSETGTTVTLNAGSYSVDEGAHDGYTKSADTACSGTIANGETKTCIITNDDQPATLIVTKHVINDNGGSKGAADFTLAVTGGSASPASFAGSETGTTVTLNAGSYSVDEGAHAGYDKSIGANCSGTIGNGETRNCTITNNDQQGTLTIVTVKDGGPATESDFTMTLNNGTPFPGSGTPINLTLDAGIYTVAPANQIVGYTSSGSCSQTLTNGGSATCTITYTYAKATPSVDSAMSWALHDSLNVHNLRTGASNAGASTIVFKLYGPSTEKLCLDASDGTHDANRLYTETVTGVAADGNYPTVTGFKVTAAGTYRWVVTYGGDDFNNSASTACGDETHTITVGEPQP